MLLNILKIVAFDVLILLKSSRKNKKIEGYHSTLVKLRTETNNLLRKIADSEDSEVETSENQKNNLGLTASLRPASNLTGYFANHTNEKNSDFIIKHDRNKIHYLLNDEGFLYFINEASDIARNMMLLLRDDHSESSIHHKMSSAYFKDVDARKRVDIVEGYLSWFANILSLVVDEFDVPSFNKTVLERLSYYRSELKTLEYEYNLELYRSDISNDVERLNSKLKSDINTFIDQSLISVASRINESGDKVEDYASKAIAAVQEVNKVKETQSLYFQDIETVKEFCDSRKESIEEIFTAANRKGMASSFSAMANGLKFPMFIWGSVFVLTLLLMVAFGYDLASGHFDVSSQIVEAVQPKDVALPNDKVKVGGNAKDELLTSVPLKVLIISPLIWLAWFSGRQYGHASKLRQDYSYKSAVAMAYHGYKEEASSINAEMHVKLLENIVSHFSENPVRLYEKCESASPLEEVLSKLVKEKPSEIIKAIKG
ncbi:hypothetical protein ACEUCM_17380 [Aeromonas dhakensis]|uniref:hypothetical protein n=1 Tax=Aeromonas dhakensis TaxID=196024 RepID=UPI0038D0FA14